MRFDVRPILHAPGKQPGRSSFRMDLVRRGICRPASHQPPCGGGGRGAQHRRCAGAGADGPDHAGRGLRPVRQGVSSGQGPFPFSCLLAEELQNEDNDEIVLLEDGEVDVGDLARTAFILGMDTKTLCSEDCKGLCPRCGADLNLGPCSCKKEADPRLAVLAKLLENRENE